MARYYKKEAPYFDLTALARENRKKPTPEEEKLWELLRVRRFHGFKIRRQHPIGSHIVDFYCPEAKLVVEVDGGQHFSEEGKKADKERDADLRSLGFEVLRYENWHIKGEWGLLLLDLESRLKESAARLLKGKTK